MAVVNPRLEMARRAAASSGVRRVTSVSDVLSGRSGPAPSYSYTPASQRAKSAGTIHNLRAMATERFHTAEQRANALRVANGGKAEQGGVSGFLHTILDNPITKVITAPLNVLDYGRRMVISGVHEVSDAIGSGDASWQDFWKQASDPTYGVGRYVKGHGKWMNRIIGFLGDVVADPLTYVSFGASKFAGASGRLALAGKAAEAGLSGERLAEIARWGRVAMTAEEVEQIGVKKAGIYFFGKRVPLPGATEFTNATEKRVASARLFLSDTRMGNVLRRGFTPTVQREARLALARGEVPAGQVGNIVNALLSRDVERMATNMAKMQNEVRLHGLLRQIPQDARRTVHEVLEGVRPIEAASASERAAVEAVRPFYDDLHRAVADAMAAADPESAFQPRQEYVTHVLTRQAREEMDKTDSAFGESFKYFRDTEDPLAVFQERKLSSLVYDGKRPKWFGTELTKDDLSIKRLNEIAREGGFHGDVFETDINSILTHYIDQHAQQMGRAARWGDLKAKGVFADRETRQIATHIVDDGAVQASRNQLAEAVQAVAQSGPKFHASAEEAMRRLRVAVQAAAKGDTKALVPVAEHLSTMADDVAVLAATRDAVKSAVGTDLPSAAEPLLATIDTMTAHLDDVRSQLESLVNTADLGSVDAITKRIEALGREVRALSESQGLQLEFNNLLAHNWDQIVDGSPSGVEQVDRVAATLGLLPQSSGAARFAERGSAHTGGFQSFVETADLDWWGRVAGAGSTELRRSNVARLTRAVVEDRITRSSLGSVSVSDLREAGAWMLARHHKVVGGGALAQLRDEIGAVLERAAVVDDLSKRAAIEQARVSSERALRAHAVTPGELMTMQAIGEDDVRLWNNLHAVLAGDTPKGVDPIELTDDVRAAIDASLAELQSKTYSVGGGISERTFTFDQMNEMLAGGGVKGAWTTADADALRAVGSIAAVKAELQDSLQQFHVVSDAHQRFALAARQMAPLGGVPTEAMFKEAMRAAGKRSAERWDAQVAELSHAMAKMEEAFTAYRSAVDRGVQPGLALRQAIDETVRSDELGTFQRVAGPFIAAHDDPRLMLAKSNDPEFVRDVIRPWFEGRVGPWQGKGAAMRLLRETKIASVSPFSADAEIESGLRFFAEMLGGDVRRGVDRRRLGGSTIAGETVWRKSEAGTLSEELDRALRQQSIYASLGEADMDALVRAGDGGSVVADSLRHAADGIADATPGKGSIETARRLADQVQADQYGARYEAALADQQLADGLNDLARYDLHRVVGPNGEPGFFLPDGRQIVDASGNPITFTRAEGESLFRGEHTEGELRAALSRKVELEGQMERGQRALDTAVRRDGPQSPMAVQVRAALDGLQSALDDVQFRIEASLPETQASALAKARVLVDPYDGIPWSIGGAGRDMALHPNPDAVAARQQRLAAAHAKSSSRLILDDVSDLQLRLQGNLFNDWLRRSDSVATHIERLRGAADGIDARVASMVAEQQRLAAAVPLSQEVQATQARLDALYGELEAVTAPVAPSTEAQAVNAAVGAGVADLAPTFDSAATIAAGAPLNAENWDIARQWIADGEQFFTKKGAVRRRLPDEDRAALGEWLARVESDLTVVDPESPLGAIFRDAVNRETSLIMDERWAAGARSMLDAFEKGQVQLDSIPEKLAKGVVSLEALGLPGLVTSKTVGDVFINFERLRQPEFARAVNRWFGSYTKFFKTYAVFTPGFHVRNIISNSFAMLASGANPLTMTEGFGLWRSLRSHMVGGGSLDTWLATLPEAKRGLAEIAAKTMWASDSGFTSNQLAKIVGREETRLTNNAGTRLMRRVGEYYETSSRFMLGYDAASKGLDFHGASAVVKRYLFDYKDVSAMDQNIQAVVPFWIWMSRNFPMQMVTQWTNPRTYAIYEHLVNNFQTPIGSDQVVPSYITEAGGWQITPGGFLTPDLGFNRLRTTMEEASDPRRLLSYVNPAFRLPVELLGGRQLYNDVPFPETDQPVDGPLGVLFEALGAAHRDRHGQLRVDPKLSYGVRNLLPPLAQADRLLPSSPAGKDKRGNSVLGYLGIPFKQVTQGMEDSEIRRRKAELVDLMKRAKVYGE